MIVDVPLDLDGRRVLIVGPVHASRRAYARYTAAGARVEVVSARGARLRLTSDAVAQRADVFAAQPDLIVWIDGADVGAVEDAASPAQTASPASAVPRDPPAAVVRAQIEAEARRLRIWLVTEPAITPTPNGHVTLVGGGPGDADLMTIAGRRALAEADVVLYDRLGPREHVEELAPGAELIDVGKTPGHHAVPQREIEAILVDRALRGLRVVRLKGGDPFVFGRGGEELAACRVAGVPATVVPGVTSAISVPGAAGIPVTHREVSRAFTVVSGHVPFSDDELGHLAGLGSTIVVLMGVNTLPHLVAGLQRAGMRADMPLAIVERGFSLSQRTTISTVGEITSSLGALALRSPAVIVIGEVVRIAPCEDGLGSEAGDIVRSAAGLA